MSLLVSHEFKFSTISKSFQFVVFLGTVGFRFGHFLCAELVSHLNEEILNHIKPQLKLDSNDQNELRKISVLNPSELGSIKDIAIFLGHLEHIRHNASSSVLLNSFACEQ